MNTVKTVDELNSLLEKNSYVILDFYTPSCPPCNLIAPYVEELSQQYPVVAFVKVDCSKSVDIPSEYNVSAVPTFIFLKNKVKVAMRYGANREELLAAIKENFS
jgi:thiol-disulfide isomerase/thioredoxin